MKHSLLAWGLAAVFAAAPGPAQQVSERFAATLTGKDATPEVVTQAVGVFTLSADQRGWGTLGYRLEARSIKGVTAACIHFNAKSGPMVIGLSVGTPEPDGFASTGTITAGELQGLGFEEFLAYLTEGKAYVSVHTEKHPGGEIQGKIAAASA